MGASPIELPSSSSSLGGLYPKEGRKDELERENEQEGD
jgi:hypothetical protein